MLCTGKLIDASIDIITRKPKVTFLLNENAFEQIDEIKDVEKLKIEAKKYRNKRSLDANAYCWVLIGKLAEKLNMKDIEVYRKAISEVGVYEVLPIKDEAVERFAETWKNNGLGWICEKFKSRLDGYTNVKAYYGSSAYDSKEMSRLIDNIITECKEQGIETMTPNELESLIMEWGNKNE